MSIIVPLVCVVGGIGVVGTLFQKKTSPDEATKMVRENIRLKDKLHEATVRVDTSVDYTAELEEMIAKQKRSVKKLRKAAESKTVNYRERNYAT
jgi:hypothetical protein